MLRLMKETWEQWGEKKGEKKEKAIRKYNFGTRFGWETIWKIGGMEKFLFFFCWKLF